MSEIPVSLAAEGSLDEQVLHRLLRESGRSFVPGACYGKHGKDHLRQNVSRFNQAAVHIPFIILTDLDDEDCAPALIGRWLPQSQHKNLMLRIAVREVEAWLMADAERLAPFLGVAVSKIPRVPDDVPEPKALLINLARQSRKRDIRLDMVPSPGGTSRIGRNYIGQLTAFVLQDWQINGSARLHSPSLDRAMRAIENFDPTA